MTAYFIHLGNFDVTVCRDKAAAHSLGNNGTIVTSEEDVYNDRNLTSAVMLRLFNDITKKNVNKFSDRKNGARRLWEAIVKRYGTYETAQQSRIIDDAVMPNGEVANEKINKERMRNKAIARKRKRTIEGKPQLERKWSSNRDRHLVPVEGLKHHPYPREGTKSHWTWDLIVSNPGKTFKEYIQMGGRVNTINDAIRRGFLTYGNGQK